MSTTEMYYDAFLETLKDEFLNGDRVMLRCVAKGYKTLFRLKAL